MLILTEYIQFDTTSNIEYCHSSTSEIRLLQEVKVRISFQTNTSSNNDVKIIIYYER